MKRLIIKRLFLLVVLGFIWESMVSSTLAADKQPINIGITTDCSSASTSQMGIEEMPIYEMVVKEVNAAGGINGRPIKLSVQDNGGDPQRLLGILKMFKELKKCVAVCEGITSTMAVAAKAWAEQNHIPIISPEPMTDQVCQKEGKAWFFRTVDNNTARVEATLMRINKLGYTKVCYEGTTLAWGTDMLISIKKQAPQYGIEVVGEVLCEPKSKDLTIQASTLRAINPKR